MILLSTEQLSYIYPTTSEPVFEPLSLKISQGDRIGLIGPNGCGKSTLLRLLAGHLQPSQGRITIFRKELRVAYLPQDPARRDRGSVWNTLLGDIEELWHLRVQLEEMEAALARSLHPDREELARYSSLQDRYQALEGYTVERRAKRVMAELGFTEQDLERPYASLSGGEKTKVALACLLLREPTFLLLDEPTNHLDRTSMEELEAFLMGCKSTILLTSHDRAFLDKVVTKVLVFERGRLREFSGNYSFYWKRRQEEKARLEIDYQQSVREIRRLKKAASGKEKIAGRFETLSQHDFYRARGAKVQKTAQSLKRRVEQKIEVIEKPWLEKEMKLPVPLQDGLPGQLLSIQHLTFGFELSPLFERFSLEIRRGERLALLGPNGSGKSTLMKLISGFFLPWEGEIMRPQRVVQIYYDQEHRHLDFESSPLLFLKKLSSDETRIRTLLGGIRLPPDDHLKPIAALSPGQRAKVALAAVLLKPAGLLLLDEPVNYLDIETREALEEGLLDFEGGILFTSHDRIFVERVATAIVRLR
ncbi:MAG: ABC-F family ATP-binding cassette domain-containing protein [Candidatus Tectomicrobia bacterium]|nr:ABC-F family ATP-binding cassette domain-containing protein [Candidatus Tectomicrobia bacterium]